MNPSDFYAEYPYLVHSVSKAGLNMLTKGLFAWVERKAPARVLCVLCNPFYEMTPEYV